MKSRNHLNTKQVEELAKLFINFGHLIFGSFVLKSFEQKDSSITLGMIFAVFLLAIYAYWMGIKFLKHINNGKN